MQSTLRQTVAAFVRDVDRLPRKNTPGIRGLRRKLSKDVADAPPRDVLAAAGLLIAANLRWVGYELVHHHRPTMEVLRLKDVEHLGQGMAAWDHVDTFACYISGPAWRTGRISDAAIHRWARSRDRWWRRAALVSTVPLNVRSQGGTGDPERTLAVCRLLVADRDDMVEKALSWALRCLIPHDSGAVERFLGAHSGELGARVRREVTNKLSTGLKNPKRRSGAGRE